MPYLAGRFFSRYRVVAILILCRTSIPMKKYGTLNFAKGGVTSRQKPICCATSERFSPKSQIHGFFLGVTAVKRALQGAEVAL